MAPVSTASLGSIAQTLGRLQEARLFFGRKGAVDLPDPAAQEWTVSGNDDGVQMTANGIIPSFEKMAA